MTSPKTATVTLLKCCWKLRFALSL